MKFFKFGGIAFDEFFTNFAITGPSDAFYESSFEERLQETQSFLQNVLLLSFLFALFALHFATVLLHSNY